MAENATTYPLNQFGDQPPVDSWMKPFLIAGPVQVEFFAAVGLAGLTPRVADVIPNETIAGLLKPGGDYSAADLGALSDALTSLGTTRIDTRYINPVLDGQEHHLEIFLASGGDGSDHMTNSAWVRDTARVAINLCNIYKLTGDESHLEMGRSLLESLVVLMTTQDQQKKFEDMIEHKGERDYIDNPANHPAIKFFVDFNQNTVDRDPDWGHNQDAWQMLAVVLLDAIEQGYVEMSPRIKGFLEKIPAFLDAIDYTQAANKGSWEEIAAKGRLSVTVWEWATLVRLLKAQEEHTVELNTEPELLTRLIDQGTQAILTRFPDESASLHSPDDPEYRERDSTIFYVGLAEVPELMEWLIDNGHLDRNADYLRDKPEDIKTWMYDTLFASADTLYRPDRHGFIRYPKDSYQITELLAVWDQFAGKGMLWTLPALKDHHGVIHYTARAKAMSAIREHFGIEDTDHEAVWNHPNNQAALLAIRTAFTALRAGDLKRAGIFCERAVRHFNDSLWMITGDREYTLAPKDDNGKITPTITHMQPGVALECVVQSIVGTQESGYSTIAHPGPWGPLYWAASGYLAVSKLLEAFALEVEEGGYSNLENFIDSAAIAA